MRYNVTINPIEPVDEEKTQLNPPSAEIFGLFI